MRLKENSLLLPARFLLGRKKGRAKSHVYYLDLLAHIYICSIKYHNKI